MNLQNLLPVFALAIILPFTKLSANGHLDGITCNQTIYLDEDAGRFELFLNSSSKVIEICGLTEGESYNFEIKSKNGCELILSDFSPSSNTSNRLKILAADKCQEIQMGYAHSQNGCSQQIYLTCQKLSTKNNTTSQSGLDKILAPISVVGNVPAQTLIEDVFIGGGCFEISNVVANGNANARGIFSGGMASIGIEEGVILSSGNVTNAEGPNDTGGGLGGADFNEPGDADLNTLQVQNGQTPDTEDRMSIEFDFTPTVDMIQFDYVFASEEYCEYVGDPYTDVFGFFISGPGIPNGGFTLGAQNIAVLPGTGTSISINTVNNTTNTGFFIPNNDDLFDGCGGITNTNDIQFDGWTTVLTAVANVQACETYHIKLVIADNFDGVWDSAVFLAANSFSAGVQAEGEAVSASNGTNVVFEQCPDGSFVFTRAPGSPLDVDIVITYTIGGTATPGADYDPLPMSVTIPAGQTSVTLPVNVIPDAIIEGQETIILTLDNPCECSGLNVEMIIEEVPPLEATLMDVELCGSGSVTLSPTVTGGNGTYTYMWDTGDTGSSISVMPTVPTTYIVTVTDECNGQDTASATVIISTEPTAEIDGMYNLCSNATPPTVDIPVTFTGIGPWTFTYTIDGVAQPPITTSDNPYTLTVVLTGNVVLTGVTTGSAGTCVGTAMGSVTTTPITINAVLDSTPELCAGAEDGTLTVTASGGTEPYSYTWSNGAPDAPTQTNVPSGSYSVTVTDADGCTTEAISTVDPAPPLTADLTSMEANCTNNGGGNITLTVGGGAPTYTYAWSDGSSGPNLPNAPAGSYTVTVTDMNGCTAEAMVDVDDNTIPPDAVANGMGIIDCNNEEMQIDGNGSSTGPDITYQWSGPGIVSGGTTLNPTINAGGTYTILVTDSDSGCTAEATVDIMEDMTLPDAVANLGPFDCTTSTLELDGFGSSEGPEFTYEWSGPGIVSGGTTLNPTIDQAGTYTILVTNTVNGCTNEASVSPDPPTELTADLTSMEANCTNNGGGNITLTVGGGTPTYTYAWSDGSSGPNLPNAPAGSYTVTVTDMNGCTAEAMVDVDDNTIPPDAVANGMGVIDCNNEEMQIDGNGSSTGPDITYQWSGPGIVSGGTTLNPTINAGGTYTILVTDNDSGCTAEATVDIIEDMTLPDAVANLGPFDCATSTLELDGIGSSEGPEFTYEWSGPGIVSGGTTLNPTINQTGTYTILVTNTVNGCTNEASVSPDPPTELTASLTSMEANCTNNGGGNITLTVGGGTPTYTYAWSDGSSGPNLPNAPAGSYTVTVTDMNGCTAEAMVDVDDNTTPPDAVANGMGVIDCNNEEMQIDGNGSSTGPDITYQWSGPGIVSGGTTLNPTINAGGTYTIIVTDNDSGCTAEATVDIMEDMTLPDAVANLGPFDCATSTLELDGFGSSEGPEFTYQWSGPGIVSGGTTLNPTINQAGTYTILVTNTVNGCTNEASVSPDPPTELTANLTSMEANCTNNGGGNITLTVGGGTPTYAYAWSDGSSGPNLPNAPAGPYSVTVTDMNGCTAEAMVEVDDNTTPPDAVANGMGVIDCDNEEMQIDGNGSSTGPDITYQWSGPGIVSGGTTLNPTINAGGTYTIIVTDNDSGCTAEAMVDITEDMTPPDAVATGGELDCNNMTIIVDGIGSSQGGNIIYQWSGPGIVSGGTTLTPEVNQAGTYTILVTNTTNGCTAEASTDITDNNIDPIANASVTNLTCVLTDVDLNGTGSSTGPNITYQWTGPGILSGETTLMPNVDTPGDYTLVVTDNGNGCTAEITVNVMENITPPIAVIQPPGDLGCVVTELVLNSSGSSIGGTMVYNWSGPGIVSGGGSFNPTINAPGTYTLVITNTANGCTAEASVDVIENIQLPDVVIAPPPVIDCNFPTITLDGTGSTNDGGTTYQWTDANGTPIPNGTNPTVDVDATGTYILVVTNSLGCSESDGITVTDNLNYPFADAGPTQTITCTETTVFLDGVGSDSGPNITYQWFDENGVPVPNGDGVSITTGQTGTYELVVTETGSGCTTSSFVTVDANSNVPVANIFPPDNLTCVVDEVTLNATITNATNVSAVWSTSDGTIISGGNTLMPTVSGVGVYDVVLTDEDSGCTAVAQTEVLIDDTPPNAVIQDPPVLGCTPMVVSLDGTLSTFDNNTSYFWTGNIVGNQGTLLPLIIDPGTYTLIVTNDINGCTDEATVEVVEEIIEPDIVIADPDLLNCFNSEIMLDATGSDAENGTTYQWLDENGNEINGATDLTYTVMQGGTFTFVVTTETGCVNEMSVTVDEDLTAPTADAGPNQMITCTESMVTLDGSNSSTGFQYEYEWINSIGDVVSDEITFVTEEAGTYELVVTNLQNGCTANEFVMVNTNSDVPTVSIDAPQDLDCIFTEITLNATTSSTDAVIEWTTPDGDILNGETTLTPTIGMPGTYEIVITDNASGCTAVASAIVEESIELPTVSIAMPADLDCNNPTTILDGTMSSSNGNFQYDWTTAGGNILSGQNTLEIEVDAGGFYTLTILNLDNGCEEFATVEVDDNTLIPTIEIDDPDMITCTVSEVEIFANNSSTGSNLTYEWTTTGGTIVNNGTTLNPTVGSAGTYTLTIINGQNGCTATESIDVTADANIPQADAGPATLLDCITSEITLMGTATGGANLTYNWTTPNGNILNNGNTLSPTIDAPGTYILNVVNPDNNCETTSQVIIEQDTEMPVANAGATAILNCTNPTINLDGTGSSNDPDLTIVWTTADGNILNGGNTLTPEIDGDGTYTLTISNPNNNCTGMDEVVITENFVTPTADAGPSQTMGCGTTDLELNGTANSTNNPFLETTWTTGDGNILNDETTLNPTIDAPGTYTLDVLDPTNGCTATASVQIFQNTDAPDISIGPDAAITCTVTNVNLEATVNGNTANYIYEWTTTDGNIAAGTNTLTPNVDAAGTYQLLVTDTVNNCTDVATLMVTQDANIPQAAIEPAGSLSCNSTSVTLDASNSTTGAGITYEWTTTDGNFTGGQTTLSPTIDAPGLYTLTVTDANNNCINTTGITVEMDTLAPTVIPQADGVLTCEIEEINLDGSNSTTDGDLTYLWTTNDGTIINGADGLNPLIGAPGTYTLTIIDNENGCDNSADLLIEASADVPVIAIEMPDEINCLNDSISIDATNSDNGANFEIEWTTADGNILNLDSPLSPVVDASGTYNLLITNTLTGCSSTQAVPVFENTTPPIAEAGQADEVNCYTPTLDLNGDGSSVGAEFSYAWTTLDGNITANANSLTPTVDSAGVYQILVTNNENGCTTIADVAIGENFTQPNANAGQDDELSCAAETLELNGGNSTIDANTTIVWTTMDGNFVDNTNTLNPTVDQPGTYTLELLNTESGCNSISEMEVTQDTLIPMVEISPAALLTCDLEEFALDATDSDNGPSFTYEWTTSDGNILSGDNTLTPNIDEGGTYILTITNIQNDCSATANITIDEDTTPPVADAGATQELTCEIENVILTGDNSSTGMDFIYEWSTTGGTILSGGATLNPNVAADGNYQILVTDQTNGCTAVDEVEITEDTTLPDALIADPDILNCYQDTLLLNAETSSQGPNFIYEWSTTNGNIVEGGNTLTPAIDEDGFYQILVTNTENGCTSTFFTEVSDNFDTPIAEAGPEFELSCTIDNVTLDGGASTNNPDVTYEWISPNGNFLSGQNSLEPNVNATGIYTLIVTNTESGCSAISETEVTQDDDLPNADAGTADALTCNVLSVNLDGSNSDTGAGFTYEWSTMDGSFASGQNTLTPTVDAAGVYVLTITNTANDCSTVSSVTVPSNTTPPLADAGAEEELSCDVEELSLDGGNSATGVDFTYEWTTQNGSIVNGATTLTPNIDEPGTYQILVTDLITGCTATDEVEITESLDVPVAAVADPAELTCAELMVDLDGNPSSQGANISYQWSTADGNIVAGDNTINPTVNEPGTYEIIVTDSNNGCTNSTTVVVSQNIEAPNAEAGEADDLDCETDAISLNGQGSSMGASIMYEWSTQNGNIAAGQNTLTPTVTAVGEYMIEVMDANNGCASMDMVLVEADEDLPLTVIASPEQLTCADEVVVLNGENSDQGPNFVFEWSTPNGNILTDANAMNSEVDAPGDYTLLITNTENGCTESASVAVGQDVEEPTAEAGQTFTLDCLEDVEFLNGTADGNGAPISTTWTTSDGLLQSGINTLSPGISQAGVYTLTVTNLDNGCSTSDNVLIETDGPVGEFFIQEPVCYAGPGAIAFQNIQGGVSPYLYSIDGGNTFETSGFFPNLPAGNYDLVVQDANGCEDITETQIVQPEEVIVQVTIDEATIQLGEDFQIVAQTTIPDAQIDTIIWTPSSTLSCDDCLTPIASPDFATVYNVVVTDHNGCSGEDALFLQVEKDREIHLPNIFSPNGDGDNDVFMIFSDDKSIKKIESFLVFSRWGETVFQYYNFDPNQPAFGWDGTHRGEDMDPAVFVWFAEVEFFDGVKKIFKGDVVLMR